MAVKGTLTKGYDLDYMWKSCGSAEKDAASYYMAAAEGGSEPPGRWWGPAAEALGFARGQLVERKPYDLLFGGRLDPRDGVTQLGRPPARAAAKAGELYRAKLAAEPHATAERQHELRNLAAQEAKMGPLYFDLTLSFSKSISVFHASLGENARHARLARDTAADAHWSGMLARMDQMIYDAVHAGFDYFQREAGYTRTGHHGTLVNGQDAGQWHEAALAVVHWLQHTSRDEDMQLHVHSQILHSALTQMDGKWRAPDSLGFTEFTGAVSSRVALHLESAMTREFGVSWVPRPDGYGREIQGIAAAVMDLFSSRRQSIDAATREQARKYKTRTGRKPSQRLLAQMAQNANTATRKAKPKQQPTAGQLHARWADKLRDVHGIELASLAPQVMRGADGDAGATRGPESQGPSPVALAHAAQEAVARAQAEKSSWCKADLIKHLGMVLSPGDWQIEPNEALALLDSLAERALAGEFGPVTCLEAPQYLPVPDSLIRADGRSVYQRHGGTRYATRGQLTMEEHLLERAARESAPVLARDAAARELGADAGALDAILRECAQDAGIELTSSGLRADQAAALFHALTSGQTASVIVGPAGSGKTRTLAHAARTWQRAGNGAVCGVTPSQASANVLRDAGVPQTMNFAAFLGHSARRRGEHGIRAQLPPGSLLLIDEGSMFSTGDLADVISYAAQRGHKVILSGDSQQLAAVRGGGGMSMLARRLGYAQLAEPVRFHAQWEREASLRLRAGDVSVLSEYDAHGRIRGAPPEQAMDRAARDYVAHYLAGTDVLLMAAGHADCRELSRRIQDDLRHLGRVSHDRAAELAQGAQAGAGDLVIARENDHKLLAGEPGRTLANGDVLYVDAVNDDGSLQVRRAIDADPQTGARRFAKGSFTYRALSTTDLAYAVTGHSAQGRTVAEGLALIRGTEDRQWTYVALSRAANTNTAIVMTSSPTVADLQPGSRAAPELGRYDRISREREGLQPFSARMPHGPQREAVAVLAGNVERDGAEVAALDVLRQGQADADHLGLLAAMFDAETAEPRAARYRQILREEIPPGFDGDAAGESHQARWLYRTLRTAELAGLDARQVLRQAIGQSPLTGARDVASVIDARIRKAAGPMVLQALPTWSEQVPEISDPSRRQFVEAVAAAMDDRKARLGKFAAEHEPAWALRGLGAVPGDPVGRLDWEQRAADVAAYREMDSYDDPAEPIGPEPAHDSPVKRAAWYRAFAALGPVEGIDLRTLADGTLLHRRGTYEAETAWAPRYVADELRQVRAGAADAALIAVRADAEALAARRAGESGREGRHVTLAASARAMEGFYRRHETELDAQMTARRAWEIATAHQRRMAVAADSELRRRHPDQEFEPLRSAEPEPVTKEQQAELDLQPEALAGGYEVPGWFAELLEQRRTAAEILANRRSVRVPSQDPDADCDGQAWPEFLRRDRDAILQPPKPQIRPTRAILERVADREAAEQA